MHSTPGPTPAVIIGGSPSIACRIFWTTGTTATPNTNVQYVGNILAGSAVSPLTDARS